MNKTEFLEKLKIALSHFSNDQVTETLHYYEEAIDDRIEDGMTEEEAVSDLETIEEIAHTMELELPMSVVMKKKINLLKSETNDHKTLWMVLAICGAPLWFPLLFAGVLLILSVYIVIWSLIFSLVIAVASFALASISCVFSFVAQLIEGSFLSAFQTLGGSIACAGLFLMLYKPMIELVKQLIEVTKKFGKWLKKMIIGKKGGTINEA